MVAAVRVRDVRGATDTCPMRSCEREGAERTGERRQSWNSTSAVGTTSTIVSKIHTRYGTAVIGRTPLGTDRAAESEVVREAE